MLAIHPQGILSPTVSLSVLGELSHESQAAFKVLILFTTRPPKKTLFKFRAKHPFGYDIISEVEIYLETIVLTSPSKRTGNLNHFSLPRENMVPIWQTVGTVGWHWGCRLTANTHTARSGLGLDWG